MPGSRGKCRTYCRDLKVPLTCRSVRLPGFRRRALPRKQTSRPLKISFDAGVAFESAGRLVKRQPRGAGAPAPVQPGAPRQAVRVLSCAGRSDVSIVPGNIERNCEAIERLPGAAGRRGGDSAPSLRRPLGIVGTPRACGLAHRCKGTSTTLSVTDTANEMQRAFEEELADVDDGLEISRGSAALISRAVT